MNAKNKKEEMSAKHPHILSYILAFNAEKKC